MTFEEFFNKLDEYGKMVKPDIKPHFNRLVNDLKSVDYSDYIENKRLYTEAKVTLEYEIDIVYQFYIDFYASVLNNLFENDNILEENILFLQLICDSHQNKNYGGGKLKAQVIYKYLTYFQDENGIVNTEIFAKFFRYLCDIEDKVVLPKKLRSAVKVNKVFYQPLNSRYYTNIIAELNNILATDDKFCCIDLSKMYESTLNEYLKGKIKEFADRYNRNLKNSYRCDVHPDKNPLIAEYEDYVEIKDLIYKSDYTDENKIQFLAIILNTITSYKYNHSDVDYYIRFDDVEDCDESKLVYECATYRLYETINSIFKIQGAVEDIEL